MATFDFIECSSKAYKYVWDQRQDILLFSMPFLVFKVLSFVVVILFSLDDNFLRQGLVLLPSHFFEGFMIATLVLRALSGEEENAYKSIMPQSQAIYKKRLFAATIIYTLLKLLMSFTVGMTFLEMDPESANAANDSSPGMFILSVVLIGFLIWAFRFVWLYIPVLLGHHPVEFLIKIKSFASSIYMLALWAMCTIPASIILIILSQGLDNIFGSAQAELARYASAGISAAFDYLMVLVSSLGMAYGISSIYNDEDKNVSLL